MKTAIILLSAGLSKRYGGSRSKLLEPLGKRRVIDITINSLKHACPSGEIYLVSTPEFRKESALDLRWIEGGARRQDSARNGIISVEADRYLIHDAARPFISKQLVDRLLDALSSFDGVAPGLPVTDTLKRISNNSIFETPDRNEFVFVQTPQALKAESAKKAFQSVDWNVEYTDDLAVMEKAGFKTGIVEGEPENIKITRPEDLIRAKEIYKNFSKGFYDAND
ncbi:TPA: hypothetical protein DEF17_02355 [bacterium]|nr:MAG: hypothetical protein AUJ18_09450 [Candidatus Hydrogenedentes bacterium CG1_02_42_14]PIU47418.1 MAG: hypothetical protein COS94_07360 [Candidatus Hydrogenedentes bacterium CG07_land_8_20_14_0_80_42_17]HBW46759.1 hypothetical protein [bacterium]